MPHRFAAGCMLCTILLAGCATSLPTPPPPAPSLQGGVEKKSASFLKEGVKDMVRLSVPFSPQAPLADWSEIYNEGCEEMSLILVHHFLEGTGLPREEANGELIALTAWETREGYSLDVTIDELRVIAEGYYGHKATVFEGSDVTFEKIKELLSSGHPVIVPLAGQTIGNPYYSGDGPPYHMLVITGYTKTGFITNDVGTKRGEGFEYPFNVILNAIHDWTGDKETILEGRKAMMILERA